MPKVMQPIGGRLCALADPHKKSKEKGSEEPPGPCGEEAEPPRHLQKPAKAGL